ncbi:MAG: DNA-processing protein DprA [Candidatus Riflebacteria bacterium]|nr:DNA-processing protein DprA [Candidatus Riflebacteria bacterium]
MNNIFLQEFSAALQLSRLKGVGAATFRQLLDRYHIPSLALASWLAEAVEKVSDLPQSRQKSATRAMIENAVEKVGSGEFKGLYYSQSGYPSQLHDLGEPPPILFSSDDIRPVRFAAIVGSRKMAAEAERPTRELVRQLVAEGYSIVSGGAAGVDAVAHHEALCLGSYTVAVLATGLDIVYPRTNATLFDNIRQSGVLLSEMMPGAKPQRSFFPTRNRIIAALADVVAIVQAGKSSGALITAAWASKLGRRLLVLAPQSGCSELWAGNAKLIEAGAGVYCPGGRAYSVAEPVNELFDAGGEFFSGL